MKTRRKKKDSRSANPEPVPAGMVKPPPDEPRMTGECRGFAPREARAVDICSAEALKNEGSIPVVARFHDVDTAELVVVDEVDLSGRYTDGGMFRDRFVKVAPRIAASERDAFDGPAIAAAIRAAGARAVVLAPVIVPEIRRTEPERVVKRTPRETVKAWFEEQKGIEAADRDAALELVLGFMDSEGL